jgi:rhodanese-related sulfurtransferase
MPGLTQISATQLARLIGTADAPTIIDVRIPDDFAAHPHLIPTAIRAPHKGIDALAKTLTGRKVVVVCQRGQKLSEGAAALLRTHGIAAEAAPRRGLPHPSRWFPPPPCPPPTCGSRGTAPRSTVSPAHG